MTPSKVVPYCILILQYQNKKCNRRQNGIRLHCCPRFGFSGELTCCRPCENGTGVCGPSSVRPGNYRMDNSGAWCAGVFAAAVSCISILWTAFVSYCSNCIRLFSSKTIKVFSLALCGWGTIILDNLLFKFVLQHQENCKTPEKFTDNKNLINNVNYTLLCFDWGTGYKVKGKSTYFFSKPAHIIGRIMFIYHFVKEFPQMCSDSVRAHIVGSIVKCFDEGCQKDWMTSWIAKKYDSVG